MDELVQKVWAGARRSDSPRRLPLHSLRCSAPLMGTPADNRLSFPGGRRDQFLQPFFDNCLRFAPACLLAPETVAIRRVPIRAVEQRSKRGGSPLGMFEWRAPNLTVCATNHSSHEFSERPAFVSSAEYPDSFIVGAATLGSPFFGYFLWRSKESN